MKKTPPPPARLPPPASETAPTLEELKIRFGTRLTAGTLVQVHRVSYWGRKDITEVIEQALVYFFTTNPDVVNWARRPLPEAEQLLRKLPQR